MRANRNLFCSSYTRTVFPSCFATAIISDSPLWDFRAARPGHPAPLPRPFINNIPQRVAFLQDSRNFFEGLPIKGRAALLRGRVREGADGGADGGGADGRAGARPSLFAGLHDRLDGVKPVRAGLQLLRAGEDADGGILREGVEPLREGRQVLLRRREHFRP